MQRVKVNGLKESEKYWMEYSNSHLQREVGWCGTNLSGASSLVRR